MAIYSNKDDVGPVRYAARQPILTAHQKVVGYKLLFREGVRSYFSRADLNDASRAAIDELSLLGLTTLCDNRMAFISCARDILLEKYLTLLPPEKVVAEIPETIAPDADIRQACRQLKDSGYRIALGNFIVNDPRESLADFADFIKVDIARTSLDDAAKVAALYRGHSPRMLAENVETREDFEITRSAGFQYFQGYFFRKPEKMHVRGVASNQTTYLQLLQAVSRPELNWQEVEEILKRDATLFYRLLRYLNSAAFGFRGEVHSVRQALTILGDNEFRRWCRLAVMFDMSQNRPSDLLLSALIRARFFELIGEKVEHGDVDMFLLGLLSLMDTILEIPMGRMLEGLPVDVETKTLLLENKGRLSPVYELLQAVEAGAWKVVVRGCARLDIPEGFIAESQRSAMEWAQTIAADF
ncbi:MAG: HDOD domain-containing protein [Terracidiphilus sp.]